MGSQRTGPEQKILDAVSVAGTSTYEIATTVEAKGNSAYLEVLTETGSLGDITFTAAVAAHESPTSFMTEDGYSWELDASSPGRYRVELTGLNAMPQDTYKFSYQCSVASGDLTVWFRGGDDLGGSSGGGGTVDGTGLATESTLDDVKTATETVAGAVSGTEMQVDVVSSALPTGAATESTLGSVQTAVELIDDTVATEDAAIVTKGIALVAESRSSAEKTAVSADGDAVILVADNQGRLRLAGHDLTTDATNIGEVEPISEKYVVSTSVLTNVPNATPDETVLIDMDGFRGCSVHIEKTGGTDTFTATMESSGEGSGATVDWVDTTQYGWTAVTAATAASYTADVLLFSNPGFTPRGHKVKITTAGTADDADFNVFVKKWY